MHPDKIVFVLIGLMLAAAAYYGYQVISPMFLEDEPDEATTDAYDIYMVDKHGKIHKQGEDLYSTEDHYGT